MEAITIASIIESSSKTKGRQLSDKEIPCIICDEVTFPATENGVQSPLLSHLLSEHKLVIAEVQNVADFPKYVNYWRERLKSIKDLTDVCVLINSNSAETDKAPQEKFFLLTDFLAEDHELRNKLTTEKLTNVLGIHLKERSDKSFKRKCLFCKECFTGNRSSLFRHMAVEHSFNLGNADNIVNANELLDVLQKLLDNFQCLFCENQFKDWSMLKDHMRKKGHKRIDPLNTDYDKYYLINYTAPGKNWKELQRDPEYEKEEEECDDANTKEATEKEWSDWEEESPFSLCLWCLHMDRNVNNVIKHMVDAHDFDLVQIKRKMELGFYDQVKIVNFIRRQIYLNNCPSCLKPQDSKDNLKSHLEIDAHYKLTDDRKTWDQPQYFFPTFEDDSLLYYLEDDLEEEDDENQNNVNLAQEFVKHTLNEH